MAAVIEVVVAVGDEEGRHQHDRWAACRTTDDVDDASVIDRRSGGVTVLGLDVTIAA
jgi:hypothetical protein